VVQVKGLLDLFVLLLVARRLGEAFRLHCVRGMVSQQLAKIMAISIIKLCRCGDGGC
jgi:hypothetical protein